MQSDKLWVSCDDDDGWVTFHKKSSFGELRTGSIQLYGEFTIDHVHEALSATGLVDRRDDGYVADSSVDCQALCDLVEEMFRYFKAPGAPGEDLVRVQKAVQEYDDAQEVDTEIPLWAYAWLDLNVRNEIADEARGAKDIWSDRQLTIDLEGRCDRHVTELIARYSRSTRSSAGTGRMAPSSRQRREPQTDDRSRTG